MQKESIDLMNIEYEDVLHLYRGWRKSENAVKDKDKELAQLREKIKSLQESHSKFRSQIQSLESFKELTISLQTRMKTLEQENVQLRSDNHELVSLNEEAEKLLQSKEDREIEQTSMLHSVQLEVANLKGRYEETSKAYKELEKIAHEEQVQRMSYEQRIADADASMQALREENRQLRSQLESTRHRVEQCDQELLHASEQLASISQEVLQANVTRDQLANAEAEAKVLRGDLSRLLRLIEQSPACRDFFDAWLASDGGMTFVGMDREPSASFAATEREGRSGMLDNTTFRIDRPESDFDAAATAQELSEMALSRFEITPNEFAHLKRIHGGDPFPMTSTLAEEQEYWVPSDAARLGVKFMRAKFPGAPTTVIMDFLRNMNKIWLRRERRKVKRVKEVLGSTIEDLKRQLSQTRPYKGVIQERQIRRLKSQVKSERVKSLSGRPRSKLEQSAADRDCFQEEDFDFPDAPRERRLCRQTQRTRIHANADVNAVSTEKLLAASLTSLQNIGKRVNQTATSRSIGFLDADDREFDDELMSTHPGGRESFAQSPGRPGLSTSFASTTAGAGKSYPSASYLRGALWLGRNMTLISEELAEALESYRTRYLTEVSDIAKDPEPRRACHRLTLLASSGMNQAVSLANKSKANIREMLEGAAALEPGNAPQLQRFLKTLPIESALVSASRAASPARTSRLTGTAIETRRSLDSAQHSHHSHRSHSAPNSPARSRYSTTLGSPLLTADLFNRS